MEEWRSIPGYEGIYEASNLGRIRTVEGKITSNARYQKRVWKQRVLKPKYKARRGSGKKDAQVTLWKDGKDRMFILARLVAMAWCDGYSEGMTVNHIDGDTLNNRVENLEWMSLSENIRHGFNTGQYKQIPCTIINSKGEQKCFRSRQEASQSIGRNKSYIEQCVIHNRPIRSSDGEVYGLV